MVMICKKSADVLDGGRDGYNKDTWRKGNERDSCGISAVVMGERSFPFWCWEAMSTPQCGAQTGSRMKGKQVQREKCLSQFYSE